MGDMDALIAALKSNDTDALEKFNSQKGKNPRKMARKTSALESAEKTIEIEEGDEVEEGIKTTSTRRPSTRQPEKKDTTSILDEMLASFEKKDEKPIEDGTESDDTNDVDTEDTLATTENPKRARRKLERLATKPSPKSPNGKAPPKRPSGKAPKRPKRPVPPQFGKRSRTTKKATTTKTTTQTSTTTTTTTTTTTRRPTTTTTTMRPTTRRMVRTTRAYDSYTRTRMPMNQDDYDYRGRGQMVAQRGQIMSQRGMGRRGPMGRYGGQYGGRYGGRGDDDETMGANMGRLNYRRRPVDQYYDNYYSQYDYYGNYMYDTYYDYAYEADAQKPRGKMSKEELKKIKKAEKEKLKLEAEEDSRLEEEARLQALKGAEFGAEDFNRIDSSKYGDLAKKIEDVEVDPVILQYRKKESAPLAAGGRLFGYKSLTESLPEIKTDVSPFYLKSDFKIGVPTMGQNNRLMEQSEVSSCWKCVASSYSDCLIEGKEEVCEGASGQSACYVREYTQSDGIEKVYMGCQPIHQCVKDFKQNKGLVSGLTVKGHQQSDQCRPGAPGSVCHQCCSTADECNASWITNILIKND